MKAEPRAQRELLKLVELDQKILQVKHRAKNLPEQERLQELAAQRAQVGEKIVAAHTRLTDAQSDQARVDQDLDPARERLTRNAKLIDSGELSPKDLVSKMDESEHLTGRIEKLEDQQLEIMQVVEDEQKVYDELSASRSAIEDEMRALLASRNDTVAELKEEAGRLDEARRTVLTQIPDALVTRYDKIAARLGFGAASLKQNRCSGCGLELDPAQLKEISQSAADDVVTCSECGRILVRG